MEPEIKKDNLLLKEEYLKLKIPSLLKITKSPEQPKLVKTNEPVFIFDVDDTLYNFKEQLREYYIDYLYKFAQQKNITDYVEICRNYYLNYGHESLGFLHHHKTHPQEYFDMVDTKAFTHFIPKINNELIDLLKCINYKMYCFTNGYHSNVINTLGKLNILHFFEYVIHPDYDGGIDVIIKPSHDAFAFVEEYLQVDPKNIYFFDDNKYNVKTALERGWNAYIVDADNLTKTLKEVIKKLNKMNKK